MDYSIPFYDYKCSNTYQESYDNFSHLVKSIITRYQISDFGRGFMIMPYFSGVPFRISIKNINNSLKTMFYCSICKDCIEIVVTDIFCYYGITDSFIKKLINSVKSVYEESKENKICEIILSGNICTKQKINDYCVAQHISRTEYIMNCIRDKNMFSDNVDDIFFYIDKFVINRVNDNVYKKIYNDKKGYLFGYFLYKFLRIDNNNIFNKIFCWNYCEILERANSKISLNFYLENCQIADGFYVIEVNDYTCWNYVLGKIHNVK